MFIKNIITYNYNYAEYTVSDNESEIICVCMSVPLKENKEPKIGMEISTIEPFSVDDIDIKLSARKKTSIEKLNSPLSYFVVAKVINCEDSIVKAGEFTFNLINDYKDGFKNFKKGDLVEFSLDRFDCYINDENI